MCIWHQVIDQAMYQVIDQAMYQVVDQVVYQVGSSCMVKDPCIGETDRVKRKLQWMCYWLYPFILLD